jgi:hypothetical protein
MDDTYSPEDSSEESHPAGVPTGSSESTSKDPVSEGKNPEVVEYCKSLTENLEILHAEEKVKLSKEDGSFEILGDEGREREIDRIQQQMKKYCQ